MVGIVGPIQGRPVAGSQASKSKRAGDTFAVSEGASQAGRAALASPAVALDGMIALQEAPLAWMADEARDREARRHGGDILEELAALQRTLLGGEPDEASLHRLEALTRSVPLAADPRLVAVMRAVSLRARVELARREPR